MDNEVAVMRKMVHPFIVSMVDTFRCGKFGYIIMSVADGGDLLDRIIDVGFSEAGAACVTRQILQVRSLSTVRARSLKEAPINAVCAGTAELLGSGMLTT